MKIEEKTLVVVKPLLTPDTAEELLGIVRERSPYGRLSVEMIGKIWAGDEGWVIPLCGECELAETPGENLRKHLPNVIVKLTLMIDDLKRQVEKLSTEKQES